MLAQGQFLSEARNGQVQPDTIHNDRATPHLNRLLVRLALENLLDINSWQVNFVGIQASSRHNLLNLHNEGRRARMKNGPRRPKRRRKLTSAMVYLEALAIGGLKLRADPLC